MAFCLTMAADLALARLVGQHRAVGKHEAGHARGREVVHDGFHPVKMKTPDVKWRSCHTQDFA